MPNAAYGLPLALHAIEADSAIYSVFPTHAGMNRRMMERQRQPFCTRLRATWKTSGGCWRLFPEGHPCGHVDAHHMLVRADTGDLKLTQLKTLDLAGGGLWQFRDEFNPAWILIGRNFRFHKILQLCRQLG
jgi:hypothetical protein